MSNFQRSLNKLLHYGKAIRLSMESKCETTDFYAKIKRNQVCSSMTGDQNKRTPYLFIILRALDDSGMYAALRTNFTCELNEQFYFELPNTQ